jgi:ATP-dependent Lon protease
MGFSQGNHQKFDVPLLPLRDVVVFPGTVMPLFVGRSRSVAALDAAMKQGKQIVLLTQKTSVENQDPTADDLYDVGTLATILQMLRLPDDTIKVLVEGQVRCRINQVQDNGECFVADIERIEDQPEDAATVQVLFNQVQTQFEAFAKMNRKIPNEVVLSVKEIKDANQLVDVVAAHINLKLAQKQEVLALSGVQTRLEHLLTVIEGEIDLNEVEGRIRKRVKTQMERNQREYYLNEQIKAIQKELGNLDDSGKDEFERFAERIVESGMPEAATKQATAELKKLKSMPPMSAEASVVRNYLDWLLDIPWKKRTRVHRDLVKAQELLNARHYGLDKVKERILEYLAVQSRVKHLRGPILCLVGPPGVGKTSLAQSIAEATHREYVRFSLGGVRDEAEIRGHRRTYLGAMPGKIIQKLSKVKVKNPLFLLDEIDKMARDVRGDPASALLEVLDPEQHKHFSDHYLDVDYDLSEVMFVATSNSMDIPAALLDRMEVIRLSGYTEQEKHHIAQDHLWAKQLEDHGLKTSELVLTPAALTAIIQTYTREAGVRSLDRELAKLARKAVKHIMLGEKHAPITIDVDDLEAYLGVARYRFGLADTQNRIGQVTGLAWTSVGGELLTLEATVMPGKGRLVRTGKLGDVMKESIEAAMSVVRARGDQLGIVADYFEKQDFHLHVPEGATPKDGPSAGIGICVALVSAATGIPVRCTVAMTGEITLRGEVLPIGGLKEKLLAALRGGITTVLIPHDNVRDLKDVPDEVKNVLDIQPVRWIDEVLALSLERMPEPALACEMGVKTASDPESVTITH